MIDPMIEALARAEYMNAEEAYANPQSDWDQDDLRWAYQAMRRAELKLRSFDVV